MGNAYDIRQGLISQAQDLLLQHWHQKQEVERRAAELESRAPCLIPPVTASEIVKTAEELYQFVTNPK
jgi:hypothetical protein